MKTGRSVALLILGFYFSGCVYRHFEQPVPVCNPDVKVSFESTVQPILTTNCAVDGCHNGTNPAVPTLVTFQQVKDNAEDISLQISKGVMPPTGAAPLSARDLAEITCWVNQGASTP